MYKNQITNTFYQLTQKNNYNPYTYLPFFRGGLTQQSYKQNSAFYIPHSAFPPYNTAVFGATSCLYFFPVFKQSSAF